jgi:hypothetical protein
MEPVLAESSSLFSYLGCDGETGVEREKGDKGIGRGGPE